MAMMRSLKVARVLVRASVLSSMQYRGNFFFDAFRSLLDSCWALVPLLVIFSSRRSIAGWTVDEALLVSAWFTLLKGLLEGVITPSLSASIEQIRRGTFDFVLVKPIDAQLYASVNSVSLASGTDILLGVAMMMTALVRMHRVPTFAQIGVTLLLTTSGITILYALNVLALSVAFFVTRIDNLLYLINSLFDAARWPSSVFSGALRVIFTFVLPLGLMTTYPPLALLGRIDARSAGIALAIALFAIAVSRFAWLRAVSAYRSAGG